MDKIFKLNKREQLLVQFIMLAWVAVVLIPFGAAVLNALKPNVGQVFREPFGLPDPGPGATSPRHGSTPISRNTLPTQPLSRSVV